MKEESPYVTDWEELESRKFAEELSKLTVSELLERFDESADKGGDGKILNSDDYFEIPKEIRNRLSVPSVENVNAAVKIVLKQLEKLEAKFRNHRHEKEKSYTAKPEW